MILLDFTINLIVFAFQNVNHQLSTYTTEMMMYFSEAPLAVKEGLLNHMKEIVDYFETTGDTVYEFDNVSQIQEEEGTLFSCEFEEYKVFKNIALKKVSNCLNLSFITVLMFSHFPIFF